MLSVAGGLAGFAALTILSAGPGAAATAACASGTASAISANVSVLNSLNVNVPTLPVATYPKGQDSSVVNAVVGNNPALVALHVLHASAGIEGGKLATHADLADVSVLGLIQASVLDADCTATATTTQATSDIVDLKIGQLGVPGAALKTVDVIPAGQTPHSTATEIQVNANTPIPLNAIVGNLLGVLTGNAVTVTFDEQIHNGNTLTVNALHVHVDTSLLDSSSLLGSLLGPVLSAVHLQNLAQADIVVSSASCTSGPLVATGGGTGTGGGGGTGGGSGGGTTTTTTPAPTTTTAPPTTSKVPGVTTTSDNHPLPFTGVTAIVPMIVIAAVLVAAGGGLFWFNRRRRLAPSSGSNPGSDS